MDREDAKEYLRAWLKYMKIIPKYWIVYKFGHWSRLIGKFYSNLINKSVNKPKLFKFFGLRWCAWMLRANYWFDRCDALRADVQDPLDTMDYIVKFYRFDM